MSANLILPVLPCAAEAAAITGQAKPQTVRGLLDFRLKASNLRMPDTRLAPDGEQTFDLGAKVSLARPQTLDRSRG
jgi:hypothetical protein